MTTFVLSGDLRATTFTSGTTASPHKPSKPPRALALRVQLLFEAGPEQPFLRIEDVDAFAAACRTTGADEHATLAQLARVSDA